MENYDAEQLAVKLWKNFSPINNIWGTLGWANDKPFSLIGKLGFSRVGNIKSLGATGKIVKELKSFNPLIDNQNPLIERFIDFSNVDFEFPEHCTLDGIPELRLTLFLEPNEGALVYYQHNLKNDVDDSEADIEFIMPQATDKDFSTNRDRLHYFFDIQPKKKLEIDSVNGEIIQGSEEIDTAFVIKILTFKRDQKHPETLIKEITSRINNAEQNNINLRDELVSLIGRKKYALLKYNPAINVVSPASGRLLGGSFEAVDEQQVDYQAKTLLLLHGTFSSTYNTFDDLLVLDGETSFMQTLVGEGKYGQILAFDHPTITNDAFQNVTELFEKFIPTKSFASNRLDVISCSRGGVLTECLAGSLEARNRLEFNKVLMFSPANGVGYFTFGQHLSKFLSVYRKTVSGPYAKIVLAFAQFSADFFLSMPGCQQMTLKKSNQSDGPLERVLKMEPNYPKTLYKTVVSDWEPTRGSIFNRAASLVLDRAIALILGREHDWVVGCTSQRKLPIGSESAPQLNIDAMHTKYLDKNYVHGVNIQQEIRKFLLS
jgi:hypothetical protein